LFRQITVHQFGSLRLDPAFKIAFAEARRLIPAGQRGLKLAVRLSVELVVLRVQLDREVLAATPEQMVQIASQ
jgi:hypothetical protein